MDRVLVADKLAPEGMAILRAAVDAGQLQVDERVGMKPDELCRAVGDYQGHVFYLSDNRYRGYLGFVVEAVDDEFTDEFGGSEPQIVGVSTCGSGDGVSHHLIYLVGLGDPDSTIPGDRFLGTYELVPRNGEWVVGASNLALYTDWQLELDDPLSQIACGDVQPWGS